MTDHKHAIDGSKAGAAASGPGQSEASAASAPDGKPRRADRAGKDDRPANTPVDDRTVATPLDGQEGATSLDEPARSAQADCAPGGDAANIEGDFDELVAVAAQRDEYLALAQRTQADFENYRKRVARESALALERGVARLAKELLPAIDNLDRALKDAGTLAAEGGEEDPLLDGVRLVRSELGAALARVGVESFSPLGESFDPAVHEAMATTQQPANGAAGGTVVEVYQPGYRLGASIIRPARVVVAA
jgi:molecular chaperone GrpE